MKKGYFVSKLQSRHASPSSSERLGKMKSDRKISHNITINNYQHLDSLEPHETTFNNNNNSKFATNHNIDLASV